MQRIVPVLFLFLLIPTILSAQTRQLSNHIDFLQVGTTFGGSLRSGSDKPVAVLSGYHFTTLKIKRLNMLGLGVAWMGVNDTDSVSPYQDIALTTPLINIRLGKPMHSDKVPSPTYFLNINYGYGLINKEHGLFFGISLGSSRGRD